MCLFYETPQDLLDIHSCYFSAGLEDGELCIWAASDPVDREMAIKALGRSIPNFDHYLRDGQIELLPGYEWYLQGDEFDPRHIVDAWYAKIDEALARGFAGIRISGNAFWLEASLWKAFHDYETELARSITDRRMLALCTYWLCASSAVDVLDVARAHKFSIARRDGVWEFLETPEQAAANREFNRQNNVIDLLSTSFPGHRNLTDREQVVLAQVVKGASSKEAARTLAISPRTVEFHRKNIMQKLGARNAIDLLAIVLGKK